MDSISTLQWHCVLILLNLKKILNIMELQDTKKTVKIVGCFIFIVNEIAFSTKRSKH